MSFDLSITRRVGEMQVACTVREAAGLTALVGPSGAGKTSVLNMIAGLLRPDEGYVRVHGQTLFDSGQRIDLPPERRRAGYVFQDARLFPHRSVAANLRYGERLAAPGDRLIDFDTVVPLLGIGHLLARRPHTLSGGEVRRVAIGRALLSAPRFLLLDEPLSSIDRARREEIMALLERIRDAVRVPILLVTHDMAEAERLARRIVHL